LVPIELVAPCAKALRNDCGDGDAFLVKPKKLSESILSLILFFIPPFYSTRPQSLPSAYLAIPSPSKLGSLKQFKARSEDSFNSSPSD
jgi:hypothetical protein